MIFRFSKKLGQRSDRHKQLWRLLPGLAAALVTLGLANLGAFKPFELASYRWRFQWRGAVPWDQRIVLVTIDDATLAELGQFPLSRQVYTQLLERLIEADTVAIAFNLLFIEPTPADADLARTISQQGNVILAAGVDEQGRPLLPVQSLADAAFATGHILKQVTSDGLVRTIKPWAVQQPTLGLALAETYTFTQEPIDLPDLEQPLWINWPGPFAEISQVSLIDVLTDPTLVSQFDNKLVLIGMTATGTDALLTPFDLNPPASGLLLQAAVLDNLLQQRYLHSVDHPWLWVLFALGMSGLGYVLVGQPLPWQLLIIGGAMVGWLQLSLTLFAQTYLLPMAYPLGGVALTGGAAMLAQRLRESLALKTLVNELWQHYRHDTAMLSGLSLATPVLSQAVGSEVHKLALLADSLGRAQATQTTIGLTLPIGMAAVNDQDQVCFCNPLATRWLGLNLGDALTPALVPTWIDPPAWEALRQELAQGSTIASLERQMGQTWFELRIQALNQVTRLNQIQLPSQRGILLLIENITSRKGVELQLRSQNQGLASEVQLQSRQLQLTHDDLHKEMVKRQYLQAELTHQALYDTLTGLPNRFQFIRTLNAWFCQAQADPNPQFAVLFLDCDRFKLVNDSFGHVVGDSLLKAIAERLRHCVAKTDLVARFGGDEFTLLLQLNSAETAIRVAQRVRQRLQAPFTIGNRQLYTGCSIGIAMSGLSYTQAEEMLRDADIAMYRAKRGGIGYTVFEPEMHHAVRQSLQLETDLRQALETKQFVVHYQPIFNIKNQRIQGFEALIRWHHPTYGQVPPHQFIPIAEETGLIIPIGEWVLQTACAQLHTWQQTYPVMADTFISVNLSVQQFSEPTLVHCIDKVLQMSGLSSQNLKLEITESAIMADSDSAIKIFQQLKEREIRLCIDDFGTGYSSLSYLHSFPIDFLKIDQSFVRRINQGRKHLNLVQAIITLAHQLDMVVIAEGIETPEQLHLLQSMNCTLGQGYFFSPPIDESALERGFLVCQGEYFV